MTAHRALWENEMTAQRALWENEKMEGTENMRLGKDSTKRYIKESKDQQRGGIWDNEK